MKVIDTLRTQFGDNIRLEEKRTGIQQIYAPIYYEDGDMMDLFLDLEKDASVADSEIIRLTDHGKTLMRLSYDFDLDSPNKEKLFQRIIDENGIEMENGELFLNTPAGSLYPGLMQFSQALAKVSNLKNLKRETLSSLFEEMVAEFISDSLNRFLPNQSIFPIPERDDLEVDWIFNVAEKPLYLFTVKDSSKARLATISCLEFQRHKIPFRSIIVHEDFQKIPKKDQTRLTSACDKQFVTLDDFFTNAENYFNREASGF